LLFGAAQDKHTRQLCCDVGFKFGLFIDVVAAFDNGSMLRVIDSIGAVNAIDAIGFLNSVHTVDAIVILGAAHTIVLAHAVGSVHTVGTVGAIGCIDGVGVVYGVGMNMLISTVKDDMSIGAAISKALRISTSSQFSDLGRLTC
jgi:hypothetical protein